MDSINKSTKQLLDKLNFLDSKELYFKSEINDINISSHHKKILKTIDPVAFYCIDNEPFVLFFEDVNINKDFKSLSKKIWNAQIPVIVINNIDRIMFFNGKRLTEDVQLKLLEESSISKIDESFDFGYWNITNQNTWLKYKHEYFKNELNESLLKNLKYITTKMEKEYKLTNSTKLILRIIFIRFLIDRSININYMGLNSNIKESQKKLLDIVADKNKLYDLFNYLKRKMNGNLFDMSNEVDLRIFDNKLFWDLRDFLGGKIEQSTSQLVLFPMYDFNIIPIELISNIYEILLGNDKQDEDKAFYTPEYLVDYILEKTVNKHLKHKNDCKILDPTCGSGIFLVKSYKSIIEKNLSKGNCNYKYLSKILKNNIFGIDKNEDAINVTIFSLYIIMLEYIQPVDLEDIKFPDLLGENMVIADFFDESSTRNIINKEFDYIIGNPPWGRNKNEAVKEYRKKNNYESPNNEMSIDFLIRSEKISKLNTKFSFIVPSKILYNTNRKAERFRKTLLEKVNLTTIIELSPVRDIIFEHAKGPAAILIYDKKTNSENINHISFKPNIFFKMFNLIVQEKNDVKIVNKELLYKYDYLWKVLVYGTVYDFYLIKDLFEQYPSLLEIIKSNNFIEGTGVMDNPGDQNPSNHLIGKKILNSDESLNHFFIDKNAFEIFNIKRIHRPRRADLFEAPLCLFKVGLNIKNYRIKAAYLDEDFVFKRTINCIKGDITNPKHKNILKNIVGLLNSSLYSYLNLMLGSSAGIEREQLTKSQVLKFPYIYDESIIDRVDEISNKKLVNSKVDSYKFAPAEIEKNILQLDHEVLNAFDLADNIFIDYAVNIQIPQLTKDKEVYRMATKEDMFKYAEVFKDYWDPKLGLINKDYEISIYNLKSSYIIFEMKFINSVNSNKQKTKFIESNDLKRFDNSIKIMVTKINNQFFEVKDLINFEEDSFYIIKQNNYKNWHPSRAHIDLFEVVKEVLSASREGVK